MRRRADGTATPAAPIVEGVTDAAQDQFFLSGTWNFRDLGGLQTDDGRTVRPGIVFRSAQLADLDSDGRQSLLTLGITDVFDLRSAAETVKAGADRLPEGVALHEVPYHLDDDEAAPHEAPRLDSQDRAHDFLATAYEQFPTLPGAHLAIAHLLTTLANADSRALWHCAAGKDRAGWTAITLLHAIEVREEDIITDFLRSNDGIAPLRAMVSARYGEQANLSDQLLGVHEDYYRRAMKTVQDQYGGMPEYLDAIGIDSDVLRRLRDRLLD